MSSTTLPILLIGGLAFLLGLLTLRVWIAVVIPTAAGVVWFALQAGVFSHQGNNEVSLPFFLGWSPLIIGMYAGVSCFGFVIAIACKGIFNRTKKST